MKVIKMISMVFLAILMVISVIQGQRIVDPTLSEEMVADWDRLFDQWRGNNIPGISFTILQNGHPIYQDQHGLADLAHGTSIDQNTRFNVGSFSHQFIAYAILQMEEREKLQLEDPIIKYLPEFKEIGYEITIDHLLSHTSGLIDFQVLSQAMSENPTELDNILLFLYAQTELSFPPGSQFAYSLSNVAVLTRIIEIISQQSFQKYLVDHVFSPLHLHDTSFGMNYADKQTSYGYAPSEGQWIMNHEEFRLLGFEHLYTTMGDWILWRNHLEYPGAEYKSVVNKMHTETKLNDGQVISLPAGMRTYAQEFKHRERGIFTSYMTSNNGNFTSSLFTFPDQGYTAFAFSNNAMDYNGYFCMMAAYSYLDEEFLLPPVPEFDHSNTLEVSLSKLKDYEGDYWDERGAFSRKIRVTNDTLRYIRSSGYTSALIPIDNDRFQMQVQGDDLIYLDFTKKQELHRIELRIGDAKPLYLSQYIPEFDLDNSTYEGLFLNHHYSIPITISTDDSGQLIARRGMQISTLNPIHNGIFESTDNWIGSMQFKFDKSGEAISFTVGNLSLPGLTFAKM